MLVGTSFTQHASVTGTGFTQHVSVIGTSFTQQAPCLHVLALPNMHQSQEPALPSKHHTYRYQFYLHHL